jgi:cytochrome P450
MPRLTGFDPVPIPGPWAPPFIGVHTNLLRIVVDPIGRLFEMRRAYGDVVAAANGNPALVCAFGAERNREVLSNQAVFENDDVIFIAWPEGSSVKQMLSGLPFQNAERNKRNRRLMMPAFQKAALDGYASDIVAVTNRAMDEWPVGRTADVSALTRDLVQRIVVQCFFGLPAEKGVRGLGEAVTEMLDIIAAPLTFAFPFRVSGAPYARLYDVCDEIVARFHALFAEKRRQPGGRDALALILKAQDEDGSAFTDHELVGEAAALFVAGHDTQAKTLAWTLFLLEQHPAVLAAVVDEVTAVLRGGPPSPEHVPKMPLLDRVIKESMRMFPAVSLLFVRVLQAPAKVGAYDLPKGANVLLSPFVTHRDPALYEEPKRFLPSRWERIQPTVYEYLPFGAGPRMCIGAAFATQAMRLMLAMILQRYRFSLAYNARVCARVNSNLLGPKYGLPMLIAPQDRRFQRQEKVGGDIATLVDLGAPS